MVPFTTPIPALTETKAKLTYYPALTGIRAVAAIMVSFFHVALEIAPRGHQGLLLKLLAKFMLQWHIGVAIFFVLSGFLITTRYADRVEPSLTWAKRYMQNRFARIYPVYFLLTVFSFCIMLWHPFNAWCEWPQTYKVPEKIFVFFLNLTLTRSYFEDLYMIGLPTAWSLTVEETFYICAPIMLLGLKRDLRRIIGYPIIIGLLGCVLVILCSKFIPLYGLMSNLRFMMNLTFFGRSAEFIFGMGLALWVARKPDYTSHRLVYTTAGIIGLITFMCIVAIAHFFYPVAVPADWSYAQILANNFLLPIIICILFWGIISERTVLRQVLETHIFDLLGKSSYVLYLIHLGAFDIIFRQYVSSNHIIRLVTYILISIIIYKTIEHPLHKKLRAKS